MRRKAFIFVLANFLFAALIVSVYAIGYEYDKANELFPEMKRISYDLELQVYGERWVRFVKWMFGLGLLVDSVLLINWYRNKHKDTEVRAAQIDNL